MRPRKITIGIDGSGVDEALKVIAEEKKWLKSKCDELSKRLAEMGALSASFGFARSIYSGDNEFEIKTEKTGEASYKVTANGETVLFVEFGTGLVGYGHPEVGSYGPGTYPGKGHWNQPQGWYYPTDDNGQIVSVSKKTGQGYAHTFGNPPNMPMYNSVKELEQELSRVVQEVFK